MKKNVIRFIFLLFALCVTVSLYACNSYTDDSVCDHDFVTHQRKDPTCTEAGWHYYKECTKCDYTSYIELPATGHSEEVYDGYPATCISVGLSDGLKCGVCDKELAPRKEIAKTPHNYITHSSVEPSCLLPGYHEYRVCTICGDNNYREIPALRSHDYRDGECSRCSESEPSPGLEYESMGDGTCSLFMLEPYSGSTLIIPSLSPDGDYVTRISQILFERDRELMSITLPSTLTNIVSGNFNFNVRLIEIVNNSSLDITPASDEYGNVAMYAKFIHPGKSEIEYRDGFAFCNIDGENFLIGYVGEEYDLTLPADFDGESYKISDYAFYGSAARSLVIPDGITKIMGSAFYGCGSLRSISIGKDVTFIDKNAFRFCGSLIEIINHSSLKLQAGSTNNGYLAQNAVEIHSGESKIIFSDEYMFYRKDGALYLCGYIGEGGDITLPSKYNGESYKIYPRAFSNVTSLTGVTIPDGVTEIGDLAFHWCKNLESVIIGNSVKIIGANAFSECERMTKVTLGSNVTEIMDLAFRNCSQLREINIPASVTFISEGVFSNCFDLSSLLFEDPTGWWAFSRKTDTEGYKIPEKHFSDPWQAAVFMISDSAIRCFRKLG